MELLYIFIVMQADGTPKEEELKLIEEIALEMGHLFQVQDDYLDCFGNPNVTGRYGTTIQGNCSSWFIIMALKKMDCEQERVLKVGKCYLCHTHYLKRSNIKRVVMC